MERKIEQPRLGQPGGDFREWLLAVVKLPLTLQHAVAALEELNRKLAHYSQLPETLAGLVEVGQDFNSGIYEMFGGKVRYDKPKIHNKGDTE